jgi:hypothetical protein
LVEQTKPVHGQPVAENFVDTLTVPLVPVLIWIKDRRRDLFSERDPVTGHLEQQGLVDFTNRSLG